MKRWCSVLLAAAMALSVLAGCSQQKDTERDGETAAQPTIFYDITGIPQDQIVMTVGESEVPAELYFYWLSYVCSSLEYNIQYAYHYYGQNEECIDTETGAVDWSATYGGVPLMDQAREQAEQMVRHYMAIEQLAQEQGASLTEEDRTAMDTMFQSTVTDVGGEEEFMGYLQMLGIKRSTFDRISAASYLYEHLLAQVLNESSELYLTDEDYDTLAVYADHILIATLDQETGENLAPDVVLQKYAQAEELLEQIRAAQDPVSCFQELADQYSEDTGRETNPTGYIYTEDTMVPEFESAAQQLQPGEISDIVQSDYGFHIILRRDLLEAIREDESRKESIAKEYLNSLLVEKRNAAAVTYDKVMDSVDWENYYETYAAKVDEIAAANSIDPTQQVTAPDGDTTGQ